MLDARAQRRLYVLNHVLTGGLTAGEAARVLGLSVRQVRRLLKRYRADDAKGLLHGNQGRRPAHRIPDEIRQRVIVLATTTYAGVNHAHLAELLRDKERLVVAERSLRRILAEASVRPVRTRRPARHRSRRERMAKAGMLLQTDGSRHHWFGPERPFATLIAAIDDATGEVTGATFRSEEDAAGYFTVLAQTSGQFGLPVGLYSDRHGIFIVEKNRPATLTEQLTGKRSLTQVGRALDQAAIGWIGARSPQAKGRVERLWGTLQDRLVSELRLAGITTIDEANTFLPAFLARYNERFGVPAADPEPAWRRWPAGLTAESVFCFHYPRRVARDATISWDGRALGLPRRPDGRSWSGRAVVAEERLDGSLWVQHAGEHVPLTDAPPAPAVLRARHLSRKSAGGIDLPALATPAAEPVTTTAPGRRKPGPDHPWRRYAGRTPR